MKLALFAALLLGLASCATDQRHSAAITDVRDLEGRLVNPLEQAESRLSVFIFVRTDCPISNRYAPEIERLKKKYTAEQVKFWLVYPDAETKASEIAAHLKDYSLTAAALRDPGHQLVRKAGVRVTPEAAVFLRGGKELYHGRIDDRYVDFGKERPAPTRRDLDLVLQSALAGRAVSKVSEPAVGCYIAD